VCLCPTFTSKVPKSQQPKNQSITEHFIQMKRPLSRVLPFKHEENISHMISVIYKHERCSEFWRHVDSSVDANVSEDLTASIFRAEVGGSMFLRNVGI
jgi:hypothetical protein